MISLRERRKLRSRLGRYYSPDARDKDFPMRAIAPRRSTRKTRNWYDQYWSGNQGNTSQCVGYGWTHWIEDAPIIPGGTKHPIVLPSKIYKLAQQLDEWPGTDYEGSSVRGGAKAVTKLGYIGAYHWATLDEKGLQDIINTVLEVGPVVVGTNWYSSMFEPNKSGRIVVAGQVEGGHCYDINGVNVTKKLLRLKNSWGLAWGLAGHAFISFDDFLRLLKEEGEACIGTEKGVPSAKK